MPVHLTSEPLELTALLAETEEPAAGALAIFVGTVRDENEGRRVTGITYEAQPALASRALAAIEQEALARFRIQRCRLVHRTGTLAVGEASVVIVVRIGSRLVGLLVDAVSEILAAELFHDAADDRESETVSLEVRLVEAGERDEEPRALVL